MTTSSLMKLETITTKTVLLLTILFTSLYQANGQCAFNNNYYLSYNPSCTGSNETVTSCAFGGEYVLINVVAGQTYTFSTCTATYDTQLTLFNATGTVTYAYNDDGCGLQSTITWVATYTGQVALQVNQYYCGTNFTCTPITVNCSGSPPPPPPGPCSNITPLIGCGTSTGASMSGPGSWNVNACGFTTSGNEMIFSFTATASGTHSIDITSISGGFIDFFWIDASFGCSSTGWNCIDDIFTTGNYGSMNFTAGNTYYILLDPEGTGSYSVTFDVNCPNPGGPVTASDCNVAIPVCTNLAFQIDPNGYGLIDELCTSCTANPATNPSGVNSGCLLSGELNSTWFTVNVAQGGTLEFSFGASGGGNCYDWIMWDYGPTTCSNIVNNTQAPVTCNWNVPCAGFTGMASTPPAGGATGNFQPTMNVSTGDQFLICFSNYSSALTSVPLNFFGTADISCTLLPTDEIDLSATAQNGYNSIQWTTQAEVNCSHFIIEKSDDGQNFSYLTEVPGSGTDFNPNSYQTVDLFPNEGNTYYRLIQVNTQGEQTGSNTVVVNYSLENKTEIIGAYPNPSKDVVYIQVSSPNSGMLNIEVLDMQGKQIHYSSLNSVKGTNVISVPVDKLANGTYLCRVKNSITEEADVVRFNVSH